MLQDALRSAALLARKSWAAPSLWHFVLIRITKYIHEQLKHTMSVWYLLDPPRQRDLLTNSLSLFGGRAQG